MRCLLRRCEIDHWVGFFGPPNGPGAQLCTPRILRRAAGAPATQLAARRLVALASLGAVARQLQRLAPTDPALSCRPSVKVSGQQLLREPTAGRRSRSDWRPTRA